MSAKLKTACLAACLLAPLPAAAQTDTRTLAVLKGLSPVAALYNSYPGQTALAANFTVTGSIQTGALRQPTLLPFPAQQYQALRDAFIADRNLADISEGLGTTLSAAYVARAHYATRDPASATNVSKAVADLIAYTNSTTGWDSNAGKYFFANDTTDGKTPVAPDIAAILTDEKGAVDVFGQIYGHAAGTPGADLYGDSRPFQTEPSVAPIVGQDYFNVPSDNYVYNHGPMMTLNNSPSYPSGHTTYGYMGAILLAVLVPDRYQQMIARGAEYGNDRILMGAHYAMDVLGGRTLSTYDLAHLLANDPAWMGRALRGAPAVPDYQAALKAARADLAAALEAGCGDKIAICAAADTGRFSNAAMNEAFYAATQTYALPVVFPQNAGVLEDVAKLAPEAGNLLTAAFPTLTLDEANRILTETEGPGGGFLDDGSEFGVYSRLNLYAAAGVAKRMTAGR